jgi:hypothetical protein
MRSYRDEPYRLKWEGRSGFLRLALDAERTSSSWRPSERRGLLSVGPPMPDRTHPPGQRGDGDRYRGMRLAFGLLGPHLVPGLFPLPSA